MIIDETKFQSSIKQKTWLVYLLRPCEMGTEGTSGWSYHAVALGNTDEEIYNNWIDNVKQIYGVDLSKDLKCQNGNWSCYYPIYKCELPTSVYGNSEQIVIDAKFKQHND